MRTVFHLRRWLLWVVLAMPAVLMPRFSYMGLNRSRWNLGWPFSSMDILIDGLGLHFQPSLALLFAIFSWVGVAGFGWRYWREAVAQPDGLGAFVQAALTTFFCALVFCFLRGTIQIAWDWYLSVKVREWPALESTLIFGRAWAPYLYALGTAAIFATLWQDARRRRGKQRLAHAGFALCFVIAGCIYFPYLRWELAQFDELIQLAKEEQR